MNNKLPIYSAIISDENEGVFVMSLVDCPATETNWMCFKEQENIKFSIANEEEHILSGVVMVADKPIYRIAPDGTEYYIMFSKETIKAMAEKMLSDNTFNTIDIQHNGEILPEGAVKLTELFITDESKGIVPNYLNVPDGSLLANYKIYDDDLWELAKNGVLNGFSLEGVFSTVKYVEPKQKNQNTKMSKIKEMLKSILIQLGEVTTDKGILTYEGELEAGKEVKLEDGTIPADGDYVSEDGKVIVVKDGVIEDIKEPVDEVIEDNPIEEVVEEEMAEEPVEEPVEEVVEEVVEEEQPNEIDEIKAILEKHETLITELDARIEALDALIKELNEAPVVEPIEQEFTKTVKSTNRAAEMAAGIKA